MTELLPTVMPTALVLTSVLTVLVFGLLAAFAGEVGTSPLLRWAGIFVLGLVMAETAVVCWFALGFAPVTLAVIGVGALCCYLLHNMLTN